MNWILVLALGAAGVGTRATIDAWILRSSWQLPIGTLLINILGCVMAGYVFGLNPQEDIASNPLRLGLVVGFCGGFTTYSGFGIQVLQMIQRGNWTGAFAYGAGTPILCVLAASLGFFLSR